MKKVIGLVFIVFLAASTCVANLKLKSKELSLGKSSYIAYGKKDKNSNTTSLIFVEINVEKETFNNFSAYEISQKWSEKDTLTHTSWSIFSQKDLISLYYKSWWKRDNQNTEIHCSEKKFKITGLDEKSNKRDEEITKIAFYDTTFINWHCDLHLFGLLPCKEGVTFQINPLNPGYSPPKYEYYKVFGSEKLEGMDCWILNYELQNNSGYQRFWISKSEKVVLKEENLFRGSYRYKLKTEVTE
jgi:hypothetical protein